MNGIIFDIEHLQKTSYERSTKWSIFLEDVQKEEDYEELSIIEMDEIEEIIDQNFDKDESTELISMEEIDTNESSSYVDPSLFKNLNNATRLSIFPNNSTVTRPDNTAKENADIVDLVNQTMPIIHEHNRQLRETGFEKILNTFDKNIIEEKVGSWLNRHNSLFGGDSTLSTIYPIEEDNKRYNSASHKANKRKILKSVKSNVASQEESFDSDDSLQSGETARYIRSSRAGSFKKSSTSNKTIIKTYRTVKSTLKEKYAFENDNSDVDVTLCYRRKVTDEYEHQHNYCHLTKKKARSKTALKDAVSPASTQKRKILRKRRVIKRPKSEEFSDSDYCEEYAEQVLCKNLARCCNTNLHSPTHNICSAVRLPASTVKRLQGSAMKTPLCRLNRKYYYFQRLAKSRSTSSSSSSSSSVSSDKSLRNKKTKRRTCATDTRPFKRLSDCKCHNQKKLCNEFKDNADTSTEQWLVANYEKEATLQNAENVRKSLKKDKNSKKIDGQVHVICNSTAVSVNSPAFKRQFNDSVRQKHPIRNTWNDGTKEQVKIKRLTEPKAVNNSKKSISPLKMTFDSSGIKRVTLAHSNINSTTLRASDLHISSSSSVKATRRVCTSPIPVTDDEQGDCTVVSSTTNSNLIDKTRGILIYTPNNPTSEQPEHHNNTNNGYFTITKDHLSSVLGEKLADKFLKYYIGRRRFNINSTIYYLPPKAGSLDNNNISSSSNSDDCLDNLGQFGDLYECL